MNGEQNTTSVSDGGQSWDAIFQRFSSLEEQQAELVATREKLQRERQSTLDERARNTARLLAEANQLKQQRAELEARNEAARIEREVQAANLARETADDAEQARGYETEDSSESATSASDARETACDDRTTLTTLRYLQDQAAIEEVEAPTPVQPRAAERPKPAAGSDEEASIEQYMAELLNRMRGGAPAEAPVVAPQPSRSQRKSDPRPQSEEAAPQTTEAHAANPIDMPVGVDTEIVRRIQPQITDLSALRELANTQARIAIDKHGQKKLLKDAVSSWGAAVACLAMSLFMLTLIGTAGVAPQTSVAICAVAGVYWCYRAVQGSRQLATAKAAQRDIFARVASEQLASEPAATEA